ncbi:MAG: type VII secretion system-associated protein [Nocardia sp.]|nr:type VII secretion system-associated protein [Nocardia sp.]
MLDPAWGISQDPPPPEIIVGGWMAEADGSAGPFQPNPRYRPSSDEMPTDPIDAVLRRIAGGEDQLGEKLLATVRDCVVAIGCDEDGRPLVGTSPDGVACIVIATAELQKSDIDVDRWVSVRGAELAGIAPTGVDILINPAGAAPFRLTSPIGEEDQQSYG